MTPPPSDVNYEVVIGFVLFIASELIGMSRAKENSLIQLILHMGSELFPYELQRKEPATRHNRPRPRTRKKVRRLPTSQHETPH